ncbi:MAG TPA: hypothetical protein VMQ61_10950 [Thermoanaerobaculia bacterium]|nr:hypothetical protein [Thermoanaerobaculia bacterium]
MPEQIGAIAPGRATDTLVARTIFGLVVRETPEGPMARPAGASEASGTRWEPLKPYSTSDAAADEIVSRFRRRFEFREIRDGFDWVVFFGFFKDKDRVPTIKIVAQVRAATRPLAVCEAGLALVDKMVKGQI